MEKQKKGFGAFFKKVGASFQRKGFRSGVYATVTSVLVIVAVIVVNLMASATGIRKDMTAGGEKSLTEETKELLEGIEDELTFYLLTKEQDTLSFLEPSFAMYVDLYERASDKITFENVDLMLNPKFAEPYTDQAVIQYSIIVVNEATGLSRYVSIQDMVLVETTMNTQTFQYEQVPTGLDVEGQLNAAIRYVISGQQTNFYAVSGHGERALGTEGQNLLRKANINFNTLETMTISAIPEDCDVLYITVPSRDYSEDELKMFMDYADRGGDFFILAEKQTGAENYDRLLAYCGVKAENRVIVEGDSRYHNPATALELFPTIEGDNDIAKNMSAATYLPVRNAYALSGVTDGEYTIKITPLLSTSSASYAKKVENDKITLIKEDGDPEGPFRVGMYLKNEDTKSEAIVVSGGYVFRDEYLKLGNYANASLLTAGVNYMAEAEVVSAVRTLSFDSEELLTINAAQANAIAVVIVIAIPVILMVIGICIMLRRRRR